MGERGRRTGYTYRSPYSTWRMNGTYTGHVGDDHSRIFRVALRMLDADARGPHEGGENAYDATVCEIKC